jgi:hypothetical protein
MRTTMGRWTVLAVLCLAFAGCATSGLAPGIVPPEGIILEAKAFPEVELLTTGGQLYLCKLARLEKDKVAFLPSPYWNMETKTATLKEIHSIRLPGRKGVIGRDTFLGFGVSSIIFGLLALATSKYDVHYEQDTWGVPLAGVIIGVPLGFLFGIGEDAASPPSAYDFTNMTPEQIYGLLRRLMGI